MAQEFYDHALTMEASIHFIRTPIFHVRRILVHIYGFYFVKKMTQSSQLLPSEEFRGPKSRLSAPRQDMAVELSTYDRLSHRSNTISIKSLVLNFRSSY